MKYLLGIIVVVVLLAAYYVVSGKSDGFAPGLYAGRNVPMLLDDSGTDNNFWLFDRHRDRINGLYRDAKWIRTGCCELPFTYDKMLPWGSRLYVAGN